MNRITTLPEEGGSVKEPFCGSIDVGAEFVSDALRARVVRVQEHAGTTKVWYRRSDGKDIAYQLRESWQYEGEFREKFEPASKPNSDKGEE